MQLSITQEAAGHTADGLPLYLFVLGNRHGMEVRINTLGGAIAGLRAPDRQGHLADIVQGSLPDAGLHLLPAPGLALHRQAWHALPLVEDASVGLRLVSPGPQPVVASYELDEANCLSLRCEASVPHGAAPPALSLHVAFNLAGEADVRAHLLTLCAARVAPAGQHEQDVAGTPWDCRLARPAGDLPGPARYLFDAAGGAGQAARAALRLADPACGRTLDLFTNAASARLGTGDGMQHLWLELAMAAAGGSVELRLGPHGLS